ncbi:trimeric intracellular cation channel type B [Ictalurus punctatus]|uniref:Trimeric intracellular cation channel type B n=1 Tax=Ictalurus punctatus TaxID=7998 RepID=A0A2D0T2S8_ICTPU|nr:trimeric intracellular cation channel type B [Ictalurus punctatus]
MDLFRLLNVNELAVALSKMNMFPYFDAAHYIVSVMSLREQPGALEVSRRSPLACWFSAMLYCFGGAVLSGVIMAEAPIEPLANSTNILLASLMWYLVFYCPQDVAYSCATILPIRLVLTAMKEVTRTWKVLGGVTQASRKYKDSLFVMIAVGWSKGAGGGLISNFEQLVRGIWKPETNELLKMTYPTKVTLIGSVLFSLQQCQYLPVHKPQLMLLYTAFIVINKTRMMLMGSSFSLFAGFESALYEVLFARPMTCSPLTNQSHSHSNIASSCSSSEARSTSCVTNGSSLPQEQCKDTEKDKKKTE